jgi:hypothetical protein
MPSAFAVIEDRLFEACEATFGEAFEHLPYAGAPGGGLRTPDASRVGCTLTGIFQSPLYTSTQLGSEARGSTPATMEKPAVSIDQRRFVNGPPQRLDRLRRVSTGEVYEISNVQRDGEGRWLLAVKRVVAG